MKLSAELCHRIMALYEMTERAAREGVDEFTKNEGINATATLLRLFAEHKLTLADIPEIKRQDDENKATAKATFDTAAVDSHQVNALELVHHLLQEWSDVKPHEYVGCALWILHAHVFNRFEVTPRLATLSPVRGCGKTELVRLIETLVPKPERSDSITPAAIYHIIDERHPTMLLDEGDNIGLLLPVNGIYRAVLNSGHRRGGCRTILHRGRVRRFSTHAPLLVAGIGSFPLPLMHRAVVIEMERHDGSSELKRFTGRDEVIDYIYGRLRSWAHDVELNEDPELPPQLRNRGADNWRPLIAIADSFGPEWGRLARNAAIAFARGQQAEDAGVILLYDIRSVFDQLNVDRIAGSELIAEVIAMNDYWNDWRDDRLGRKLTLGDLTRLLRQFHIQSKSIWPVPRTPSSRSRKGYTRDQFEAAWRSYCSDGTAAQSKKTMRLIGS